MKPPVTSDCSLAEKLLFVDWLKILANEKQAVQFRSPLVLVCEQKRCSHMPGGRGERILMLTLKQADVRLEYKARVRFALPYSWPNINWIVA